MSRRFSQFVASVPLPGGRTRYSVQHCTMSDNTPGERSIIFIRNKPRMRTSISVPGDPDSHIRTRVSDVQKRLRVSEAQGSRTTPILIFVRVRCAHTGGAWRLWGKRIRRLQAQGCLIGVLYHTKIHHMACPLRRKRRGRRGVWYSTPSIPTEA